MKRWLLIVALLLVAVSGGLWFIVRSAMPPAEPAALDPVQAVKAQAFIAALDSGDFAAAEAMLAPDAREKAKDGLLKTVWTALPEQLGERRGLGAPRGEKVGGRPIVTIRLDFPTMPLDARVAFTDDGAIGGFNLVPAQADAAPPPPDDASYVERDVVVGDLPATLAIPRDAKNVPAIVLVHGSGAHDRDETIGPNRPFLEIARALAARGIAVLRYEKRNKVFPDQFTGAYTVDRETTDDALAAVGLLRATDGVDPRRVVVVGHSLGAMMAPRVLQRDAALAGAVLIAAPARKLEDAVLRQYRYLSGTDGEVTPEETAAIAQVNEGRDAVKALTAATPPDTKMLLGAPASYWLDLAGYDPVVATRDAARPVLVLHGGRDYQVDDGEFALWTEAFENDARVTLKRYPELNHLMIAGTGPSTPQEYFRAGQIDARVIDDIATWVLAGPVAMTEISAATAAAAAKVEP